MGVLLGIAAPPESLKLPAVLSDAYVCTDLACCFPHEFPLMGSVPLNSIHCLTVTGHLPRAGALC